MCRLLKISASGYYAWDERLPSDRLVTDIGLTTWATPGANTPEDLVERRFYAEAPNRLWVADATYIPTWAVVLDVYSRKIVGWAMANHLRTELMLAALDMAIVQRCPTNVIHHSDHGCQYTSYAFGNRCREAG